MGGIRQANRKEMPTNVLCRPFYFRGRMSYSAHIVRDMNKIAAMRNTAARASAPRARSGGPVIPWYSSGMTAKRKVSVSLDEDLVAELEAADEALSGQVNEAIRAEVERRRRNRLLTAMLDSLDAEYGPVDETLVEKYTELL